MPDYRNRAGETPLHIAIKSDDITGVIAQLRKGADVNLALPDGTTPLMHAAARGNTRIVELLLQSGGIAPDATDANGCNAVHMAAIGNRSGVLHQLIGATTIDLNARARNNQSALHLAARSGSHATYRMLMATPGVRCGARNDDGLTAFEERLAVINQCPRVST
ncbi:Ankyrin [Oxalobacteraceae bacterium IMCC9480]|nr:Ankyrin [Oxalobacteraceae bacterium IMCC9480]NDP59805.1 ankyrin repeat domain-containing protein [Oxalobacteraceae bacterium]